MAVSIDRDSRILGLLEYLNEAASGVHQNPWENIRDKVGAGVFELGAGVFDALVTPQEYGEPIISDTGQSQGILDAGKTLLPEQGSRQSMFLPFGYDKQGDFELAIPTAARASLEGLLGFAGEFDKAYNGVEGDIEINTETGEVSPYTTDEAGLVANGLVEILTGGMLSPKPAGNALLGMGGGSKAVSGLKNNTYRGYHGTNKDFNTFDNDKAAQGIHWFSDNKKSIEAGEVGASGKGIIKEADLILENPANWEQYDKYGIDELIQQGHDGLRLVDKDGSTTYASFFPDKINILNAGGKGIGILNAGSKVAKGLLDDVDDLGFYSPTERLAANLQPKGTGQQYLGILSKGDGQGSRIQEEMADMGLDTWLKSKGKVSRDEVLDYISENRLRYGKKVGRNQWSQSDEDILAELEDRASRKVRTPPDTDFNPQYQKFSQEGGTNYQEGLLTVPNSAEKFKAEHKIKDGLWDFGGGVRIKKTKNGSYALQHPDPHPDRRGQWVNGSSYGSLDQALKENNKFVPELGYKSPHYDQANIGLTTRTQSFNTPDGNSVHLMDELQSDWHKEGKKKGYKDGEVPVVVESDVRVEFVPPKVPDGHDPSNYPGYYEYFNTSNGKLITRGAGNQTKEQATKDAMGWLEAQLGEADLKKVPNAPAKQSWINQGIKKEINQTIADGKDYFAWTGGKQQIDRYEDAMRQNVDEIIYEVGDDGKYFVDVSKNNSLVYENSGLSIEEVEKIFGKDIARQIKNNNGEVASKLRPDARTLSGDDLAIGGEGMKSFYDKDVKNRTEKIIKRLDPNAKVEVIELDNGNKVWGVKITDKMRDKVKSEGMPLYSIAPIAGAGLLGAGMMRQEEQQPQQGILY